ncbi:MAG: RNA polymerase sigma factor region1.1 domain-containing protein, partial [Rhodospirillaceae bacterium]
MATKLATKKVDPKVTQTEAQDSPLIESTDAGVKKLLKAGKERGYITYDELNMAMPSDQMSSEQIEDIMSQFSEMGINVVEDEEAEDAGDTEGGDDTPESSDGAIKTSSGAEEDLGRTDDPVRMYLREMGTVDLLSREGEIEIAKRIESGRDRMISGLYESPLTQWAIVRWREALLGDLVLLRDIVDLDATYGGSSDDRLSQVEERPGKLEDEDVDEASEEGSDEDEDEDEENNLSLSMLEEALKPQVMEVFDQVAKLHRRASNMRDKKLEAMRGNGEFKAVSATRLAKVEGELVDLLKPIKLNNASIEVLVGEHYTHNRRLVGLESQLLRMATKAKVKRESFMDRYF